MIIDLPDTTTSAVNRKLISLRENGASVSLGRVLTLVVITEDAAIESAIEAANDASREHPCRVITIGRSNRRGVSRLDAQIRVGGDAGASEVIVLRLYGPLADHGDSVVVPLLLPDAPLVAWWPADAPDDPSRDPIGSMATRRITDSSAGRSPLKALGQRAASHVPGDTDLAWTRITRWRALLAAALDLPPFDPVTAATVTGSADSPSTDLLAAWLRLTLRCPVRRVRSTGRQGLLGVTLTRAGGTIVLERPDGSLAHLVQPGQPDRRISLPPREDAECLAEELRRLDPDDVYGAVITRGMAMLTSQNGKSPTKKAGAPTKKAGAPAKKAGAPAKKAANAPAAAAAEKVAAKAST